MGTKRKKNTDRFEQSYRKASTPDEQERRMIALAVDLAEKQLREGTASPSVITQYLKLGTSRAKKEQEILERQCELLKAKTEALESSRRMEEMYEEAMAALRTYRGDDEC